MGNTTTYVAANGDEGHEHPNEHQDRALVKAIPWH